METPMLESILRTKCTGLAFIVLLMDIDTKERGMREEGKVLECTASEMERPSLVIGKMGFSITTQSSTYPISPVAVYHSKVLNAVQEARRASEKAYDVAEVDERVNRAVTVANKAANAARVAAVKVAQQDMHPHSDNLDLHIPIA